MRFEVTFNRKVQVRDFEPITIGFSAEFDDCITSRDDAFREVSETVERWVREKLVGYEAEREKQFNKARRLIEV